MGLIEGRASLGSRFPVTAVSVLSEPATRSRHPLRRLRNLAGRTAAVVFTPHKASLARLADMPLTVIGTGGIDFSAWHLGHGWGWLVTGASLWLIEHMIADRDDDDPRPV
jgi:hypothetical protein